MNGLINRMETYQRFMVTLGNLENVSNFVDVVSGFSFDIEASSQNKHCVNAKSIMSLLSLDVLQPIEIRLFTDNEVAITKFSNDIEEYILKGTCFK